MKRTFCVMGWHTFRSLRSDLGPEVTLHGHNILRLDDREFVLIQRAHQIRGYRMGPHDEFIRGHGWNRLPEFDEIDEHRRLLEWIRDHPDPGPAHSGKGNT